MCSILSRMYGTAFLQKRHEKMSFIKTLAEQVGGGIIGQGMGMLDEAINGDRRRRKQIEQQQKLTDISTEQQMDLMREQKQHQLDMWNETNYVAQMEHMKNAGLNPSMIYGTGGSGAGVAGTVGGANSGSGKASSESEQAMAMNQAKAMGLQMAKTSAEIKVLESQAEKNKADAGLSKEVGTTEANKRDIFIQNLKQQGISQWIDNMRKDLENSGQLKDGEMILGKNSTYGVSTAFQTTGIWNQKETTAIANTIADTEGKEALKELNTDKKKILWKELINATKNADANEAKAAAVKLAAEWSTGEFTNWKTWVETAKTGVNMISDIISIAK